MSPDPASPKSSPCCDILQAGLDLLDQGISVFDADLRLVAWNRPFLDLFDFPEELAVVGTPFERFIRYNAERGEYGPVAEQELQIAERVAAAATFAQQITEYRRPNGRLLLLRKEPLPNKGFVTLYSDITEQRYIENLTEHQNIELEERVRRRTAQLENANANLTRANNENTRITAALRRSEERLRLINDTIPILIGYVDRNEIYQYANKGYSDWYGHPESVTGRTVREITGEQVYAQVQDGVRKALSGEQVAYEYQMSRSGQTVFARSTLVPEITAEGETLGCFVFSHEVTEQRRMQAALVQAQKMEAIGQLTGGLAHDFNNLLTVVIGNLAALQDHRPGDAEINEFVEPALQSARRGVQLIKRLLTFSRQQPLEPQAVDISLLITGLSKLVRRSLPESIAVSTDLAGISVHALVDPGQLESALLNFALNSRDAMPEGGRLHIAVRTIELSNDASTFDVVPGRYALIEVVDNGCGMDAATLARVYEPFFTTKRFGLGSGLGLSMAYGFVKQSGGGITIQSQPGQGTSVLMVLPLTTPEADVDQPEDDTPLSHGGELALLVEDDPNVRRVVRQQLIDLGYPVIEAENGAQALEMISQIPDIAIVVSDIIMPGGLDGRQLAAQIGTLRPQIRIVLMSGYTEESDAVSGDLPVLAKPFIRQDLARALQAPKKRKS